MMSKLSYTDWSKIGSDAIWVTHDENRAMDRGYIDIAQFQRLTEEGICFYSPINSYVLYRFCRFYGKSG